MNESGAQNAAPLAAFRHRAFSLVFFARMLNSAATAMLQIAIGWEIYRITQDPLALGWLGLVQFVPNLMFFLLAGHAADQLPRHLLLAACYLLQTGCALLLVMILQTQAPSYTLMLAVMFLNGTARTFIIPTGQAILPNVVPPKDLNNAVTWTGAGHELATIIGPVVGGILMVFGSPLTLAVISVLFAIDVILMVLIRVDTQKIKRKRVSWNAILAGLRFILPRQIILGSMSLDLFAVMLGGVTAMLPIFAADILGVGEVGLGLLRSAIAIGAASCALLLVRYPITKKSGPVLLLSVAIFGLAIVVFGFSTVFWLSFMALVVSGAADMVSVVIRITLIQFAAPDDMRGRTTAVSTVLIGASNELGEFRAGLVAAWLGVVPCVVLGGAATVAIVLTWVKLFPRLMAIDQLEQAAIRSLADP